MLSDIIFAIWFFLPAGIANTIPVVAAKLPILKVLDFPVDFYKSWKDTRIFGDHKTFRGFISGVIFSIITVYIQQVVYRQSQTIQQICPINYNDINPLVLGFVLGFGSLAGDAIKSFFKRRQKIEPGEAWIPFDQLDFIIGGILSSASYIYLSIRIYILITLIYFIMHPVITMLGYLTGFKRKPL